MERTPVPSSSLLSVGYDAAGQVLEVEFSSGNVYQYFDVPEAIYQEFLAAPSLGEYLNAVIRTSFRYTRL